MKKDLRRLQLQERRKSDFRGTTLIAAPEDGRLNAPLSEGTPARATGMGPHPFAAQLPGDTAEASHTALHRPAVL